MHAPAIKEPDGEGSGLTSALTREKEVGQFIQRIGGVSCPSSSSRAQRKTLVDSPHTLAGLTAVADGGCEMHYVQRGLRLI